MRSRAHFALTDAGKRLFTLAQGIKASLLDYQAFLDATASFDGTLSVGILGALRNAPFERALASVAREYPQLKISLQVYPADDIQRQSEVFVPKRHPLMRVAAYANHLHAALLILESGAAVVPLPVEYVQSQSLRSALRPLDGIFPPYALSQEPVVSERFLGGSPAARHFHSEVLRFAGEAA